VGHGAGGCRQVVEARVGTQQFDGLADVGFSVADLDDQDVHVDDQHPAPGAGEPGVALALRRTDYAVGIAGRHHGDAGRGRDADAVP